MPLRKDRCPFHPTLIYHGPAILLFSCYLSTHQYKPTSSELQYVNDLVFFVRMDSRTLSRIPFCHLQITSYDALDWPEKCASQLKRLGASISLAADGTEKEK